MGPCSEDTPLCWASWILGFSSLLLSVCSIGVKSSVAHGAGVQDSGVHVPLKEIQGGSVLFHVIKEPGTKLEEISWGFGPDVNYTVILRVHNGLEETPTWVCFDDKYKHRVHVPNMTSLRIENLTRGDSGQYRARAILTGGMESNQIFYLTVYEPVPLPQILVQSLSITPRWCSVILECRAAGVTEDLNVTWESKGLPRELEQKGTPGPAPNSWTLAVNLPLHQPSASLTCVVSNSEDQKTVTSALGEVCAHDSHGQAIAGPLRAILGTIVAVLLILGAGLCLWKTLGGRRQRLQEGLDE
ncbi:SLAM family member 8-like isoform X2 [Equus quagga]|uniref:SLAM family member 8-like isoform X2 n=1 Tax=Equus quagga TaxID=89248 RepID=UPI001EE2767A|nr:SLAM family member 8-like isoform X2 [Equus quagga]